MPKQPRLFPAPKHSAKPSRVTYDERNRESAAVILADPSRYGAGMVAWARAIEDGEKAAGTRSAGEGVQTL